MIDSIKKAIDIVFFFFADFKAKRAENHAILIRGSVLDPDNHPSNRKGN